MNSEEWRNACYCVARADVITGVKRSYTADAYDEQERRWLHFGDYVPYVGASPRLALFPKAGDAGIYDNCFILCTRILHFIEDNRFFKKFRIVGGNCFVIPLTIKPKERIKLD